MLGADSPQLESLRVFRDSRLARNELGRRIISIYYRNAGPVNAALERSTALQAAARWLLETLAPMPGRKEQ
jgi:hypothetical protein